MGLNPGGCVGDADGMKGGCAGGAMSKSKQFALRSMLSHKHRRSLLQPFMNSSKYTSVEFNLKCHIKIERY